MVAPGARFRGVTLGLRRKGSGFSVQKQVKTKKKGLRCKITGFSVQMRLETKHNEKTRFLPQISRVMVSHHNMVSLQTGVTRGWPPSPSYATEYGCSVKAA